MNRDGIRIEKIKKDHAELLKMVRDNITNKQDNLSENIKDVIKVIELDEKSIKKQEAAVKAQELIADLTKEIIEAKTKEEVFEIRKKLNYNINKIKAEIKKRNIDENNLNEYQERATYLRKDIAKYIRFLKREDNIVEIERLYSNYDKLTKEEMKELKKALTKEVNYNRRNKVSFNEENIMEIVKQETVMPVTKKEFNKVERVKGNPFIMAKSPIPNPEEVFHYKKTKPKRHMYHYFVKDIDTVNFPEVETYLDAKVANYNREYRIRPTKDYSERSLGKNIAHFFKNLPSYIHNKKAMKRMKDDYYKYYNGNDLGSYIEYTKRRNSILENLKCIFSKSHLYSNKNLIQHDKCAKWLYEFCKKHGMDISFQKRKTA